MSSPVEMHQVHYILTLCDDGDLAVFDLDCDVPYKTAPVAICSCSHMDGFYSDGLPDPLPSFLKDLIAIRGVRYVVTGPCQVVVKRANRMFDWETLVSDVCYTLGWHTGNADMTQEGSPVRVSSEEYLDALMPDSVQCGCYFRAQSCSRTPYDDDEDDDDPAFL